MQAMSSQESEEPAQCPPPCYYDARVGYQDSRIDTICQRDYYESCVQDPPEPVDPWVRGPTPNPGCWKLLGCFCTSCRKSIPPSRKAVHTTVAYLLWGGLVEAGLTKVIISILLKALVLPGRGIYRSNRKGRSNATSAQATERETMNDNLGA